MSILNTSINLTEFTKTLISELEQGLPGFDAQTKMSPSIREHALKTCNRKLAIDSSVLLLFYPKDGELYLPFIKRTSGNTNHSGQISFPGGKYEKSDANRMATAIRETNEELGVGYNEMKLIGFLTELYIPVSNFMVLPVLAYCKQEPSFLINPFEVEKVIEMPVQELLNEKNSSQFSFEKNGLTIHAPYFHAKGHKIWGATAMILSELKELMLRAGLIC